MYLIIYILYTLGFRLLSMPNIKELSKKFLTNKSENLIFSDSIADLGKMYTIIHNRTLYFYNDGNKYTFKFDTDKISIKLTKKPEKLDVEYYTWEGSDEISLSKPRKTYYTTIKTKNTEKPSINDNHQILNKKLQPSSLPKDKKQSHKQISDSTLNFGIKNMDKKNKKLHKKEIYKDKLHSCKPHLSHSVKLSNDIESDENITLGEDIFDLKVKTLNYNNKTFKLIKDNMCLSYFKNSFILSSCNNTADNQIFKLVDEHIGKDILLTNLNMVNEKSQLLITNNKHIKKLNTNPNINSILTQKTIIDKTEKSVNNPKLLNNGNNLKSISIPFSSPNANEISSSPNAIDDPESSSLGDINNIIDKLDSMINKSF